MSKTRQLTVNQSYLDQFEVKKEVKEEIEAPRFLKRKEEKEMLEKLNQDQAFTNRFNRHEGIYKVEWENIAFHYRDYKPKYEDRPGYEKIVLEHNGIKLTEKEHEQLLELINFQDKEDKKIHRKERPIERGPAINGPYIWERKEDPTPRNLPKTLIEKPQNN